MQNKILVSIDCLTYNHEKYISKAIESFINQKTNFKFEILIHDDASTDKTADIIRIYEQKYPDIVKPIYQTVNQFSKGINIDLLNRQRAKGTFIAICQGDDYWIDPYKLEKQVNYLLSNPECSMCFHRADVLKDGKGIRGSIRPYKNSRISNTEDIIQYGGGFMATNTIVYRKSALDDAPDFFSLVKIGDYPLQILSSLKKYAYYIDESMSVYRTGVKNSWSNRVAKDINEIEKLTHGINAMLEEIDKYTNNQFHAVIDKTKKRNELILLFHQQKFTNIYTPEFSVIIDELGIKWRIKMILAQYLPDLYKLLLNIKSRI